MKNSTALWAISVAEDKLPTVASQVVSSLRSYLDAAATNEPFCLWLQGPLGAGKTTLTGHILRAFGLPEAQPVTSPTYTYMNEYHIGGHWFAHLDLYRAGASFSLEDIGMADARDYSGYVIEWPTQVPASTYLTPTHILQIEFIESGAKRCYTLQRA